MRQIALATLGGLCLGLLGGFLLFSDASDAEATAGVGPDVPAAPDSSLARGAVPESGLLRDPRPRTLSDETHREANPARFDASVERAKSFAEVASPAGSGTIEGVVLDTLGEPVEGVEVGLSWKRDSSPIEMAVTGSRVETGGLEKHLRRAAESWSQSKGLRAMSDASGRFVLQGLDSNVAYSIEGTRSGYRIRPRGVLWAVRAGDVVHLQAEEAADVTIAMFDSEGLPLDEGVLEFEGSYPPRRFHWRRADPVLSLPLGTHRVCASSDWFPADPAYKGLPALLQSSWQVLPVRRGRTNTAEFSLEAKSVLDVRLLRPPTQDFYSDYRVVAMPIASAAELELARPQFYGEHSRPVRGGRCALGPLNPGLHLVALFGGNQVELSREVVEILPAHNPFTLRVPSADPERILTVRCVGPDGEPVGGVTVSLKRVRPNGWSGSPMPTLANGAGVLKCMPSDEYFEPWGAGIQYLVLGEHPVFGKLEAPLGRENREVELRFSAPTSIQVRLRGLPAEAERPRFFVRSALADPERPDRTFPSGGDSVEVAKDGTCLVESIAPGTYLVGLQMELPLDQGWRTNVELGARRVEVREGDNALVLQVPRLHVLDVYAPEADPETELQLTALDALPGNRRGLSFRLRLNDEREVRFRQVPAGRYRLMGGGASIDVDVPSGQVLLESKAKLALHVTLSGSDGHLAQAGLRAGDLIVGFDGTLPTTSLELIQRLKGSGPLRLSVWRDSRLLEIGVDLDATPLGRDLRGLGGTLSPALRPEF